ncbi:pseudouridine synthase [Meridianimarinicoccus sp. RP-17]|uniref:pseudouridine synthase n=1 Tax=Meridianimarinicoccus zhengii TaxID=2056810 RepID=UPI000DACA54D|nr:pseudouridine synthase [Phycocomes zhengii]
MVKPPSKPPARSASSPAPKPRPKRPARTAPPTVAAAAPANDGGTGDRIAKVLARAGVASRRASEAMIAEGRVAVNGKRIDSPALNVTPADRITLDGKPLAPPEAPRLWLYHKPPGLVTTTSDEMGRPTVFDALPDDLPRVVSIGRLDLNSEGLLLLTNDGGIKRRLELPSTGWVRKYRVRIKGAPNDDAFAPLRRGITVEGERFAPMAVTLDRQQGANAWLTLGLREGRNREIRRAMEHIGFSVNRLIRISYGPFQLGDLAPGAVEEVKPRILRDQLGLPRDGADTGGTVPTKPDTPAKAPRRRAAGPVASAKPSRRT